MLKAKSFQPVAVLNQKLKGLDVFEPNEVSAPVLSAGTAAAATGAVAEQRDPDYFVIKAHWQRSTMDDYCLDPVCRRPLGAVNGSVNCRSNENHTLPQG